MKKKGFTVIELIVSFTLVTVIAIILFQLIFSLKELYVSGDIKTTLLNKQGIMLKKINDDLENKTLTRISACGVSCLTFEYAEGNSEFLVDIAANTITYDTYTMKLGEGSKFGQLEFTYQEGTTELEKSDSIFTLNVPIDSRFFSDDFGIHIIKLYNHHTVSIDPLLPLESATIVANKVSLPLKKLQEVDNSTSIWANIFHETTGNTFESYDEFLKSNQEIKRSSLQSLESFRLTKKTEELKNQENYTNLSAKDKEKMDINYQSGYFEFILDYAKNIENGTYNRWTQTSNFTVQKKLTNPISLKTTHQNSSCTWQNGILYLQGQSRQSFASGCNGKYFALGTVSGNSLLGPTGPVDTVDLWVRVDEYIDQYSLATIQN